MSTAHLDCHVCRTPLSPEDLSLSHGMAFCRQCQTLIRLDRYRPPRYPMAAASLRPQVALPEGWDIQQTTQGLYIVYRWFSEYLLLAVMLGSFCLFWLGFLLIWCIAPFLGIPVRVKEGSEGDWFGPLLLVVAGLFLTYITLACFLNTTVITVEQGYLTVVHAPLPWFQPPPLHIADITQFFVRRLVAHSSHGSRQEFYEVWAQLRQGQDFRLIRFLNTPEQALFIEQQLETFLGITDRPVPGELERQ